MNEAKRLARAVPDADGYLVDAITRERLVFYVCDPDKNKECDHASCRDAEESGVGFCASTTERAYMAEGTRPFYKRLNDKGYYGREYIGEAAT